MDIKKYTKYLTISRSYYSQETHQTIRLFTHIFRWAQSSWKAKVTFNIVFGKAEILHNFSCRSKTNQGLAPTAGPLAGRTNQCPQRLTD
jgi:hypothetical protein